MASGQVLSPRDGSMSVRDFQAFSRQTGHQLLASGERAGEFFFFLRKK
jgi:hypothetical protein